ncbi:TIGR02594 family protein [Pseudoduganella sp. FT55W]|uniref:TIGR02594 family protein n=1 Tax=Duganella rivi TaxID=2666083 RepID=A0A7X4GQQ6_9BURK|nr:TIGR02594 family protein [Duganella rivi]MYM66914.1 TIGR02594 family protein [Duganella rivi]
MTDTHFNEPIDKSKPLSGSGRRGFEVPPEVQQKVIDIIIEEARKMGFNNRDLAYYIAIAKRESSFNPDAANPNGTASGIAQVIDKTAATYGVNDSNRFDARSSIKAGLGYFRDLKAETIKDYGSAAGKFEPLIYYRYHYGEFSTRNREMVPVGNGKHKKETWHPKEFSELEQNKRYPDSKTVVDEAERIEAILNASHGLVVQLNDIMGKPMGSRKVIVVTKTPKPAGPAKPAAPAAAAPPAADATPAPAPSAEPTPIAPASTPAAETAASDNAPAPADEGIEWEVSAREMTTGADGKVPEISSESQEPVTILIPRIDVEAYNDAVSKEGMPEDGNQHVLQTHDGEQIAQAFPAPDNGWKPTPENTGGAATAPEPAPTPAPKPASPAKPPAPTNVFDAAAQAAKEKAAPKPTPSRDITFEDIVAAVKKDLGWNAVYMTSFAYVKQFYTRPKFPETPLSTPTSAPGPARQQVIGSSLPNKDTKKLKVEEKVQTAEQPAVKTVAASTDAPWMPFALKEQGKEGAEKVIENRDDHKTNPDWKAQHAAREAAKKAEKAAHKQLGIEQKKKPVDAAKVAELQAAITSQQKAYADADAEMLKIEQRFNNPDIVKYLQTTSLDRDAARDDGTAWCSSFTNWCMEQAGYIGTDDAQAVSWKNWGEQLSEPRYGAITVVTRSTKPEYHVGFYTGTTEKNVEDGVEEVEVKGKDGTITKKTKKKFRKVKVVRLLSGNFSRMVRDFAGWTVDPADDPALHLVSYRWPTEKEKRK